MLYSAASLVQHARVPHYACDESHEMVPNAGFGNGPQLAANPGAHAFRSAGAALFRTQRQLLADPAGTLLGTAGALSGGADITAALALHRAALARQPDRPRRHHRTGGVRPSTHTADPAAVPGIHAQRRRAVRPAHLPVHVDSRHL